MTDNANAVSKLLIKQAVRDGLSRYCRGLDRMDKAMAYEVFHPQATAVYHDIYTGTGHGFVDWVWESHAAMERHSHQITNVLVNISQNNGNTTVHSEAYVTVALWTLPNAESTQHEIIGRGRYLDKWLMDGERWVISAREHILDMQTLTPLRDGAKGYVNEASRRDSSDPSFNYF